MTRVVSRNKNTEDGGQCAVDTALRPIRMQASRKDGLIRVPYTLYPTNCNARGERVSCVYASVRLCVCASQPAWSTGTSQRSRQKCNHRIPTVWTVGTRTGARGRSPPAIWRRPPPCLRGRPRSRQSLWHIHSAPSRERESARARERESAVAPSRFAAPCHGRISKLPLALRAKNRFFTNRRQT